MLIKQGTRAKHMHSGCLHCWDLHSLVSTKTFYKGERHCQAHFPKILTLSLESFRVSAVLAMLVLSQRG